MWAGVSDSRDPAHPVEAGRYVYQVDPAQPAFAGCDTYDVTFGPGGLLYVSDGTSGLRVVKYTGAAVVPKK